MNNTVWEKPNIDSEEVLKLTKDFNFSLYLSTLLANRNIKTEDSIKAFFDNSKPKIESWDQDLTNRIAKRLSKAISDQEKITVHGDYDVDGISGSSILTDFLKKKGAMVEFYLPDRFKDGYGLNSKTVERLAKSGTKIIITSDCGVSNNKEITLAKELGVEVIITDHHTIPETLPPTEYIFHPGLIDDKNFHILSGAATAFFLINTINDLLPESEFIDLDDYFELALLGTISDVCPLVGINRKIVKTGLKKLAFTNNLGLKSLAEIAKLSLETASAQDIAFKIIPKLNSSGRLGKADTSLNLLISENEEEVKDLTQKLENLNKERRVITEENYLLIEEYITKNIDLENDSAIVVYGDKLHHGVIGIICSRILEKYNKPTFIMQQEGNVLKGSARSNSIDIVECLKKSTDILEKFGGHKQAGGWTIDLKHIKEFKENILDFCKKNTSNQTTVINYDLEIKLDNIDYKLYNEMKTLEPFGAANPQPVFLSKKCSLIEQKLSKDKKHLFLTFESEKSHKPIKAKFWNSGKYHPLPEKIDILFNVLENKWLNKISLELNILDYKEPNKKINLIELIEKNEDIEINFPIRKIIKDLKNTSYLYNNQSIFKFNFEDNVEISISNKDNEEKDLNYDFEIIDYRQSNSHLEKLIEIFFEFGSDNVSILLKKEQSLSNDLKNELDNIPKNNLFNNKKVLVLWNLPLKKANIIHTINIVQPKKIYLFFVDKNESKNVINANLIKEVTKQLYSKKDDYNGFVAHCFNQLKISQNELSVILETLIQAEVILEKNNTDYLKIPKKGISLSNTDEFSNYLDSQKKNDKFMYLMNSCTTEKIKEIIRSKNV